MTRKRYLHREQSYQQSSSSSHNAQQYQATGSNSVGAASSGSQAGGSTSTDFSSFCVRFGSDNLFSFWANLSKEDQLDLLDVSERETGMILAENLIELCYRDSVGRVVQEESEALQQCIDDPALMTSLRLRFVDAVTRTAGVVDNVESPLHFAILSVMGRHLERAYLHITHAGKINLVVLFLIWWGDFGWLRNITLMLAASALLTFQYPWLARARKFCLALFDDDVPVLADCRCTDFISSALIIIFCSDGVGSSAVVCLMMIGYVFGFLTLLIPRKSDRVTVNTLRRGVSVFGTALALFLSFSFSISSGIVLLLVLQWKLVFQGTVLGFYFLSLLWQKIRAFFYIQDSYAKSPIPFQVVLYTVSGWLVLAQLSDMRISAVKFASLGVCMSLAIHPETVEDARSPQPKHLDAQVLHLGISAVSVILSLLFALLALLQVVWSLLGSAPLLALRMLVAGVWPKRKQEQKT